MANIPTLKQLRDDIINDIEAEFGITIPDFGVSFFRALAGVLAAKQKLQYLQVARVQKNIFADTAETELKGGTLERFGRVKLNRNPFPAKAGEYELEVTGTVGATIPAGTIFKSDDDATNPDKNYILDNAYTLASATDTITVRALEQGLDSKLNTTSPNEDTLTATEPLLNVDDQATATSETTEPKAAETIEEYRENVIQSFRLEPQGGAGADYRLWSFDAQGVRLSYPFVEAGEPNDIDLYVEATKVQSTDGKGTPSSTLLSDVKDVIEFDPDTTKPTYKRGRQPLGAFTVNRKAITPLDVDIEISNFEGADQDIVDNLKDGLQGFIEDVRPFVPSIDPITDRKDTLKTNDVVFWAQSIRLSEFDTVTLTVDGSTVSSYKFEEGAHTADELPIPFLNSVSITNASSGITFTA